MANVSLKKDFRDGDKLFSQQLNNNFGAIEAGINSENKIIWQDGEEVLFKRYATNDIESLPILDGSIIYDVEKGRHYIDYNGARIQVGSAGKEVLVQDNEPTEEDNKIWIDKDFVNTMGTEVVDSLDGDETNMAPSVRVVKEKINTAVKDIYSEEEQLIGTWLGKPLYRKYIDIGYLVGANERKLVNLGDHNIEALNVTKWKVYKEDTQGIRSDISSSMFSMSGILICRTIIFHEDNQLIIASGQDQDLTKHTAYAILEYTKTTDSEVFLDEV